MKVLFMQYDVTDLSEQDLEEFRDAIKELAESGNYTINVLNDKVAEVDEETGEFAIEEENEPSSDMEEMQNSYNKTRH